MATELITRTWCDVHQDKGERVEGRPWTLVLVGPDDPGKHVERTVDLCEDCVADAGLVALVELVDEHGRDSTGRLRPSRSTAARTTSSSRTADRVWQCPRCNKSYDTRDKLAAHGRATHELTIAELLGEPTPYVCEDCGSAYGVPQALAVHRTRKHPAAS